MINCKCDYHKTLRKSRFGLKRKRSKRKHQRVHKKTSQLVHPIEHVIGLLGNPNVGKTSLFNALTGSHQHIGNWPGKTVEKKEGHFILGDEYFSIVDLPGTYSLTARSDEEVITQRFIVEEEPDLVCVIVDATRLERTLYLALQAMELTKNVAIIINMMDIAEKHGIKINKAKLEEKFGVPVLLVSAMRPSSYIEIKKFLYDALHTKKYSFNPAEIVYSPKIEKMIQSISKQIEDRTVLKNYPGRWIAIKVLENEKWVVEQLEQEFELDDVLTKLQKLSRDDENYPGLEIAKIRYSALHNIVHASVSGLSDFKENVSDKVDKVILHPFWGFPIMVAIYALFFLIAFYASAPVIDGMGILIEKASEVVRLSLENANSPPVITSLLVDGVIAGIGALLLFLPLIIVFYTLVAIMEDSGYLARSAYLMDRLMSKFGLQGSAFLSIVMGFGCNVTGILATRTIKNPKDRMRMIVSLSFIPCAATLGVVAFLTGVFFEPWVAALLMLGFYAIGIAMTLLSALFLGMFMKTEDPIPLIMELPEYRKPKIKNIYYLTWNRAGVFVKKAGTFIFLASIFIWFVSNIPYNVPPEQTILGYIGKTVAYITYPLLGLDWKMVAPLIFGIAAKETIIAALGIIYASDGSLKSILTVSWNIPQAISFLLFQLTYSPCFATMAALKSETNSKKLTLFGILWPIIVTTIVTTIVYQILKLIL
ncbi:MAG: ferrous iron transport protein B [Candidatus Heimdallarchaeaceae archaeon]